MTAQAAVKEPLSQKDIINLTGNKDILRDAGLREKLTKEHGAVFGGRGPNGIQIPLAAAVEAGWVEEGTSHADAKALAKQKAEEAEQKKAPRKPRANTKASSAVASTGDFTSTFTALSEKAKNLRAEVASLEGKQKDINDRLSEARRAAKAADKELRSLADRAEAEAQAALEAVRRIKNEA